ncbi:putative bifunctional diguanylate cyclase/phosphodiesterase [Aromatoleum sp.]|uniref:putative bifunctional diguanylate cyclase/phosphodiesterase n=1 Tax=Aromatoleum sp. TaxID=2307007 RepID=UPI002FCB6D6D
MKPEGESARSSRPDPVARRERERRDAPEVERAMRAHRTLSAGNRTLLRATGEGELLREMCRVIVEVGGYRVASVGYAEHGEDKGIRVMACVGMDAGVLEALPLTWAESDSATGQWAVSMAIRSGKASIGRHLLTEGTYTSVRDRALAAGYAAASAFPLRVDDDVIGALCILASEPDAFDEAEADLLGELADDLSYGISNLRMRAQHREAERTIARMAFYDRLTGLPNRVSLCERLGDALHDARPQHRSLALLVVKLGQFQEINETLGYKETDRFLQVVAAHLTPLVREPQMAARVADDEFAILLPDTSAEHATRFAHQLLDVLREPVELLEFAVDARACIGIALFPGHGAEPDALLRRASAAAAQAKQSAAGYTLYSGNPDREFSRRLSLMGELRGAIAKNELRLYCQPKVDFESRRICGAEALVRWEHPRYGMLSTGEFIKTAEHGGLITPLTHWVLEAAFRQSYAWEETGTRLPLSVNLSAYDLRDPRLLDRIKGLFATWGIPPELIQFELTESVLMQEPEGAVETLTRLKALGVELFVDDFGTGYSSLAYLQKLPVDSLKIDQSFVLNMLANEDSAIIVQSTIDLGHNLGLEVVAEGVETEAVWQRLATLGCDTAQGYFISKPIPANAFGEWEQQSAWHPQG